ncbi:MAG: ABC transporter permease [Carboxylicivirga sp.]|jgi:putative ABC transport system permease protein|nr:ABC transporter permease [Carboxylicivirga sp.]
MKSIFRLTLRNLSRRPIVSATNIIGLSVSLALIIILSVYCFTEFTVDAFQKNAESTFLFKRKDSSISVPGVLRDIVIDEIAGVKKAIRLKDTWDVPVLQFGNNDPVNSDIVFADREFFDVLTYSSYEGSLSSALNNPMSIVISSDLAKQLFGDKSAIGQTIKLNNKHVLTVSAVLKENPKSSLQFSALLNMESHNIIQPSEGIFSSWNWSDFQLILQLHKNADPDEVAENILSVVPGHVRKQYDGAELIPFKELYFSNLFDGWYSYFNGGDKEKVILLILVAVLVFIIAFINFINISVSQSKVKTKQIGVLRMNGASIRSVVLLGMQEMMVIVVISIVFAHLIVGLVSPLLVQHLGIVIDIGMLMSFTYVFILVLSVIGLSVLGGVVSSLDILRQKLRGNTTTVAGKTSGYLSKSFLVTTQFAITIVLIAFTLLVQKQVEYGSGKLQIKNNNFIGIKLTSQLHKQRDVLSDKLLQQTSVKRISFTQYFPGKIMSSWCCNVNIEGQKRKICYNTFSADPSLFEMMDLELIEGELYSDLKTKETGVVVNECFLLENNIQAPLGVELPIRGGYKIVGVVKDFHYEHLSIPIEPLVIRNDKDASICLLDLKTENHGEMYRSLSIIKEIVTELSPSFPVEVLFFDKAIERVYESETFFRRTFTIFSVITIIISCLGILALSLATCQQRTKEIGIRKVNGAKVSEILAMLNKDFIKWVAIAFVIACPIAWYAMDKWLENFAYKTNLSWWIFALAGMVALGIALLTVSWQSWRAARQNPVEALRYE